MPSVPDLTVKNYNIRQTTGFNAALKPTTAYIVTFAVGDQGPFTLTWSGAQPTPQQIKDAIDTQVRHVRETFELIAHA